jgi:hypothetical protein
MNAERAVKAARREMREWYREVREIAGGTVPFGVVWCGMVWCVVPFAIKLNTRIDGGCVPVIVIRITVNLLVCDYSCRLFSLTLCKY